MYTENKLCIKLVFFTRTSERYVWPAGRNSAGIWSVSADL